MLLRESQYTKLEPLTEGGGGSEGTMRLQFQFLTGGVPTGNGRIYKPETVKKACKELSTLIQKKGTAYGGAQHPKTGSLEVPDVSHMLEDVWADEKGNALARIKILPTSAGHDLMTILKNGGTLGVSARGYGSEVKNEKGESIVGDDYTLQGVDFVINPSVEQAYVNKKNILESAPVVDPVADDVLYERYAQAISPMGGAFRGTFDEYKAVHRELEAGGDKKADVPPKRAKLTTDEILEMRYANACALAGYKGTLEEYVQAHKDMGIEIIESSEEDEEGEGAEVLPDEVDLTEEELIQMVEAVLAAVKQKFGESVEVVDMDGQHAYVFNPSTSEIHEIGYLINKEGRIELVGDTPIELSEIPHRSEE